MNSTVYHTPVMLQECISALNMKSDGIYVDVTFGGGGHSKEILKHLTDGHLYAFDQDPDAQANAQAIDSKCFTFINANFRYIKKFLRLHGVTKVDGILADLGVSSHQFDTATRGFSIRFDGDLDMRMNPNAGMSAKEVVNEYSEGELQRIFSQYGEVHNAKTLSNKIASTRTNQKIDTVAQLLHILRPLAPKREENKYFAQVFQALRIEVNEELKVIEEFLIQSAEILNPQGRLVVMSYHSLEDRLVKNYVAKGKFSGDVEKDLFGNEIKPLVAVNRKIIVPSEDEVIRNPRARSAKLRIAERAAETSKNKK
ncbi:MAG TPA: 16S rRNA (cytosine(1402)-N(4))-methyltransferase RsmH [Cytophagales bacterium]|nr:16S rRNA (cytosine(1402)-N(4))-methyltransferase RsmH [Cytophagales bacterium]